MTLKCSIFIRVTVCIYNYSILKSVGKNQKLYNFHRHIVFEIFHLILNIDIIYINHLAVHSLYITYSTRRHKVRRQNSLMSTYIIYYLRLHYSLKFVISGYTLERQ